MNFLSFSNLKINILKIREIYQPVSLLITKNISWLSKKNRSLQWKYQVIHPNSIFHYPKSLVRFTLVGSNWYEETDLKPVAILWGFNDWKYGFISEYLHSYRIAFSSRNKMGLKQSLFSLIMPVKISYFIVWGKTETIWVRLAAKFLNIPIWRMEDGFLRSMELGANHATPYSLVLDKSGIYFDAQNQGDIIKILNDYDFVNDKILNKKAEKSYSDWKTLKLSKYNKPKSQKSNVEVPKLKKVIGVLGQVKGDASLKLGNPLKVNTNDLLIKAIDENPGCSVLYRPHPEEYEKLILKKGYLKNVSKLCSISEPNETLSDFFEKIDHAYTISSLSGLEALLHGLKVSVFGAPFYAGWGLTDDRAFVQGRKRHVNLLQMFSAAYLQYPIYLGNKNADKTIGFSAAAIRILAEKMHFESKVYTSVNEEIPSGQKSTIPAEYLLPAMINQNAIFDRTQIMKSITSNNWSFNLFPEECSANYQKIILSILLSYAADAKMRSYILRQCREVIDIDVLSCVLVKQHEIHKDNLVYENMNYMFSKIKKHKLGLDEALKFQKKIQNELLDEHNDSFTNEAENKEINQEYVNLMRKNAHFAKEIKNFEITYELIIDLIWLKEISAKDLTILAYIAQQRFDFLASQKLLELSLRLSPEAENSKALINLSSDPQFDLVENFYQKICLMAYSAIMDPRSVPSFKFQLDRLPSKSEAKFWYEVILNTLSFDNSLTHEKAGALIAIGRPKDAIELLSHAAEVNQWTRAHSITLSQAYSNSGQIDKAMKLIEKALKNDLNSSLCNEFLRLCVITGDYDLGLSVIQKAFRHKVPIGEMHRRKIYFGNGMIKEAFLTFTELGVRESVSLYFPDKFDTHTQNNGNINFFLAIFGPGDELRFSSIYPKIIKENDKKKISITCDPRLKNLFERSFSEIEFIPVQRLRGIDKVKANTHGNLPGKELQLLLDNNGLEAIESAEHLGLVTDKLKDFLNDYSCFSGKPYLTPDPDLVVKWKNLLPSGILIGLSWRSSLNTTSRNEHYLSIKELAPIFNLKGVTFINLQYDDCSDEIKWVEDQWPGKIWVPPNLDQFNQLDEVAALISSLPLVVSSATTVAEMSGALGVPTFLLSNSTELNWRKIDNHKKDVWHRTMVHVEGDKPQDKKSLVTNLYQVLSSWIQKNSNTKKG